MEYTHVVHEFAPVYDADSTVLILGSFPSVKSREQQFYYGHPRNRFWKVIAELCNEPVPESIADKKALLHRHHIALWDVIAECDIKGSSDSSIRNVIPNDISQIELSLDPLISHSAITSQSAIWCLCNRAFLSAILSGTGSLHNSAITFQKRLRGCP